MRRRLLVLATLLLVNPLACNTYDETLLVTQPVTPQGSAGAGGMASSTGGSAGMSAFPLGGAAGNETGQGGQVAQAGQTGQGGDAAGSAGAPAVVDENTAELCSDGISNDGDKYVDCEDVDCCSVRTCPADTFCGMKQGGGGKGGAGQGGAGQGGAGQGGAGASQGGMAQGGTAQGGAGQGGSGAAGEGGASGQAGTGGSGCDPAACIDQNPCTSDACTADCKPTPDDTLKPAQVANNCQAEVCKQGASASENDDTDKPVDDGNPCTIEGCDQGAPKTTTAADSTPCTLAGGGTGVCQAGACVVACSDASTCDDQNPCTIDVCTASLCTHSKLADGVAPQGHVPTAGDCQKTVCQAGVPATIEDATDLPTGDACRDASCVGQTATLTNKPEGTSCGTNQICLAGACKTNSCGDGFRGDGEECDGSDLGGEDCTSYGYVTAAGLTCKAACTLDPSTCQPTCGNSTKEPGEDCDDGNTTAGDGCSSTCVREPAVGELVITEILFNPENNQTSAEDGEWFEVLNKGAQPIDVRGLVLASISGASEETHTITSAAPLVIAPGAYVVFAKSADPAKNNGVTVFYAYGPAISFRNSDTDFIDIRLPTTPAISIDKASYSKSNAGSTSYKGASFSLAAGKEDAVLNDDVANFCPGKQAFGSGAAPDKGTPGKANDSCP